MLETQSMNIQRGAINSSILLLESRIADLSQKICDLDELQRELHRECNSLNRERNSLKNQVTPISSLPNEILGIIFEALAFTVSPKMPPTEIILSHVSQRFRDIATNTHLLWTQINVSNCTPFDMVNAYLQRSGLSSFNLCFVDNWRCRGRAEFDSLYSDVEWQTILSYMHRCRRFSAQSCGYDIMANLIDRLRGVKAPLLRSFQIKFVGQMDMELVSAHKDFKIFDGDTPALTSVRIEGWSLLECLPPPTSVTSLTLLRPVQLIEWHDFRDMVGGHQALTHLVIGNIFDHRRMPTRISLPSLKSLRIYPQCERHTDADEMLLSISAPVLEFLRLDNICDRDLVAIPEHPQLKDTRRFPCLRHLTISLLRYEVVHCDSWTLFCSIFPCITHFTLRLTHIDTHMSATPLMEALNPGIATGTSSSFILPKLRVLSFNFRNIDITSFCNMVVNRAAAGQPLGSLELPGTNKFDLGYKLLLDELRQYVEVGRYHAKVLDDDDDDDDD
jgi:F-box-like